MLASVGQHAPFDQGRQQMKLLAGLELTTKAVERTAEALGEDIAGREQEQIQRAMQLDPPLVVGEPIPVLYVEMDGTGPAGREIGNRGARGQDGSSTGPHTGGQVGMCVHPNEMGPGGVGDPRSQFHHL